MVKVTVIILTILLVINTSSLFQVTSTATSHSSTLSLNIKTKYYNENSDFFIVTLITNKKINTIEKTDMDKNQDKIDEILKKIRENSPDNKKIPIIITLNNDINKSRLLEELNKIPTLDINLTIEGDPILEGPAPIISASINASYLSLLNNIPEIRLIEYEGKMGISN